MSIPTYLETKENPKYVKPKNPETEGTVVAIVSGITRGKTCSRAILISEGLMLGEEAVESE